MKKTAIVTGSSRGIGFGVLKRLGRDGFRVVMVATGSQEKNQKALDELKEEGIECIYIQAVTFQIFFLVCHSFSLQPVSYHIGYRILKSRCNSAFSSSTSNNK